MTLQHGCSNEYMSPPVSVKIGEKTIIERYPLRSRPHVRPACSRDFYKINLEVTDFFNVVIAMRSDFIYKWVF